MGWVVGVDEAGYGPNLGPLVQTAVALRLPDDDPGGWTTLAQWVHRAGEPAQGRILVDDSKQVHVGPNGLMKLERGLAAILGLPGSTFEEILGCWTLTGILDDLRGEHWYHPDDPLPLYEHDADLRQPLSEAGIVGYVIGAKLVPTPIFNRVVAGSNSKATVLSIGLTDLARAAHERLAPDEPVLLIGDKQGGRAAYAAQLQAAFPEGWVQTEHESADESRYRILGLSRSLRVVFRPRADAGSAAVALASMLAKYLREVSMKQFNRYWSGHVPDLKPTAGYPVDARRFLAAVEPAMARLGIAYDAVWRCR